MKVGIFTRGKQSHSHKWEQAFKEGLKFHGINAVFQTMGDRPRDLDLAVLWGVHNKTITDHFAHFFTDYLVLERGYIGNRTEYTSCGFNGLNGKADILNPPLNGDRYKLFQDFIKPVRKTKGEYIVIMGQLSNDASVKHIGFNNWLQKTYDSIKEITDIPVVYRPHPLDKDPFIPEGLDCILGKLDKVLNWAHCVVTLNSNSGVDSVLAGIPTVSMDVGSMVYGITNHNIESIIEPMFYNRDEWLKEISYRQWSLEEITNGTAWDFLRGFYE